MPRVYRRGAPLVYCTPLGTCSRLDCRGPSGAAAGPGPGGDGMQPHAPARGAGHPRRPRLPAPCAKHRLAEMQLEWQNRQPQARLLALLPDSAAATGATSIQLLRLISVVRGLEHKLQGGTQVCCPGVGWCSHSPGTQHYWQTPASPRRTLCRRLSPAWLLQYRSVQASPIETRVPSHQASGHYSWGTWCGLG